MDIIVNLNCGKVNRYYLNLTSIFIKILSKKYVLVSIVKFF